MVMLGLLLFWSFFQFILSVHSFCYFPRFSLLRGTGPNFLADLLLVKPQDQYISKFEKRDYRKYA